MKKERHSKILELIDKYDISTQEELLEKLLECGVEVTQATVSRDIRDLNLVKVASASGTYKYVVSQVSGGDAEQNGILVRSVMDTVRSVACAQNIVLVKTVAGMAQAIAITIDHLPEESILGCVAGDDTIIVVTKDNDSARAVSEKIEKLFSK